MLRITTNDGKHFAGKDAREVVRKLRDTQWSLGFQPKGEYMLEVANRVQQITGCVIPLDAEGFLLGLQTAKLIVIGDGPPPHRA